MRQVVTIEMSAEDAMSMGAVLGGIVAFELVAAGDGLVCFFGEEWVSPKDRVGAVWSRTSGLPSDG